MACCPTMLSHKHQAKVLATAKGRVLSEGRRVAGSSAHAVSRGADVHQIYCKKLHAGECASGKP